MNIGQRFGRLVVIGQRIPGGKHSFYPVRCDCGATRETRADRLTAGIAQSCGCLQREAAARGKFKHGMHNTLEHKIWRGMIQRCTNPKAAKFENYGGRGIRVCAAWMASFEAFYRDVGPRPTPGHSLDRSNNDGNYEPGNVRWATGTEQQSNSRRTRKVTLDGRVLTVTEAAAVLGIPRARIYERARNGTVTHQQAVDQFAEQLR